MVRSIIRIDEEKCNGCGQCVPGCPEGALQIIEGKARLVGDLFCDGLGACIGNCPLGAIEVETREAEPYDERFVMANQILPKGKATVKAHLEHLRSHGEIDYLTVALDELAGSSLTGKEDLIQDFSLSLESCSKPAGGCPGSQERAISRKPDSPDLPEGNGFLTSALEQWPIQLHLINPAAPYFKGADLLVAADCTAFSLGGFHSQYLRNKRLIIACPKLDQGQDSYLEKITALIKDAGINTITVLRMEVPCCGGLTWLVKQALEKSMVKVPVKQVIVGINGEIQEEAWL